MMDGCPNEHSFVLGPQMFVCVQATCQKGPRLARIIIKLPEQDVCSTIKYLYNCKKLLKLRCHTKLILEPSF